MADRGRDLKFSILSDVGQFDTDKPAKGLEDLGDAAEAAGRKLDKTEKDLKSADGLDKLGDDAKATANQVDDAFDKIAKASRTGVRGVDDDAKRASDGLDDMKDEAQSTAKESAASFSDIESGLDAIQEIAANAFAGFGPAGLAAGAAAAVGLGLVFSSLQSSTDQANALKDRIVELAGAIDDAGGNLEGVDLEGMIRDWSLEIADNKSWWEVWQRDNTTNLEKVRKQAKDTGLEFSALFKGMSGSDPQAAKDSLDELNEKIAANEQATRRAIEASDGTAEGLAAATLQYDRQGDALNSVKDSLLEQMGVSEEAIGMAALQAEAFGRTREEAEKAAQAQDDYTSAVEGFGGPLGAYSELLAAKEAKEQETAQATADATTSQKDSWEDYAKKVDVSIGEVNAALAAQISAATQWSSNLATLAKRGVDEGVLAELERMGPEGAPLVAKLATASDAELTKFVTLTAQKSAQAAAKPASAFEAATPATAAAAAAMHAAAAVKLAQTITVPVKLEDTTRAAQLAWLDADGYFRRNPITIRTKGPTGQRPIRDVP